MLPSVQYRLARPASVRWLRVLFVLLAWTGPVPVMHDHGTLANAAVCNSAFAQHLADFHGAIDPEADLFFGWHLHWIWPSDSMPAESSQPHFSHAPILASGWNHNLAVNLSSQAWDLSLMSAATNSEGLDLASTSAGHMTSLQAHAIALPSFLGCSKQRSLASCLNSLRC